MKRMSEISEEMRDLIQQALDQDYNKANKIFSDVMTVKVQDVLDQEKIKLADNIYNGVEEIEDDDEEEVAVDVEVDDDQLELELEDETDDQETEEPETVEDAPEDLQVASDHVEVEVDDEDGEGEDDPLPEES